MCHRLAQAPCLVAHDGREPARMAQGCRARSNAQTFGSLAFSRKRRGFVIKWQQALDEGNRQLMEVAMNVSFKENYTPQGIVQIVLGVVLMGAPWILGFAGMGTAANNAWASGLILVALAVASVIAYSVWEEWAMAALGLWLIVSPWLLGFAEVQEVLWTHVIIGLAAIAVSAAALLHWPHTPHAPHSA